MPLPLPLGNSGGSTLKRQGKCHIQVNGDLPLLLTLTLDVPLDAPFDARCGYALTTKTQLVNRINLLPTVTMQNHVINWVSNSLGTDLLCVTVVSAGDELR